MNADDSAWKDGRGRGRRRRRRRNNHDSFPVEGIRNSQANVASGGGERGKKPASERRGGGLEGRRSRGRRRWRTRWRRCCRWRRGGEATHLWMAATMKINLQALSALEEERGACVKREWVAHWQWQPGRERERERQTGWKQQWRRRRRRRRQMMGNGREGKGTFSPGQLGWLGGRSSRFFSPTKPVMPASRT